MTGTTTTSGNISHSWTWPRLAATEPQVRGIHAQLTSHEPNDAIDELTTAARESSMPAVVLQQQREPQRGRTPRSRQQLPILIQQGPELDQLINVNLGWLHARQSLPDRP